MKSQNVIILILVVVAVIFGRGLLARFIGDDTIEYRGEKIRLSKKYLDYDDYKNDPENLHPSEVERVQTIMRTTRLPLEYADRSAAIHAIFELKFPGYGEGSAGGAHLKDGSRLWVSSVEIPRSDEERCFTFLETRTKCYLLDDFTLAEAAFRMDVAITPEGVLQYRETGTGKLLRESKTMQPIPSVQPR